MFNWFRKRPVRKLAAGLSIVLLVGLGAVIGSTVADRNGQPTIVFPESALHAAGADSSDQFAIATGRIDSSVEGLYTLDFLTGNLQCAVIYYKGTGAQKFGGLFRANVIRDLGLDKSKKPRYLMITGDIMFIGSSSTSRPAGSVVYVMDANSGNFADYGLLWNANMVSRGSTQTGDLVLLDKGTARADQLRDN